MNYASDSRISDIDLGELNDTILSAHVESENATFLVLGDSDLAKDVLEASITMDRPETTEVGPTTFEYDRINLDKPEAKSKVEIKASEDESIEAATRVSRGLGSWQLIDCQ